MARSYVLLILLCAMTVHAKGRPGQFVPDKKRQAEIRAALVEHGYESGKTWMQTQDIMRQIARVHHWQHVHSPDARVLILLGLGNPHSDPWILYESPTRLEPQK